MRPAEPRTSSTRAMAAAQEKGSGGVLGRGGGGSTGAVETGIVAAVVSVDGPPFRHDPRARAAATTATAIATVLERSTRFMVPPGVRWLPRVRSKMRAIRPL